MFKFLHNIIYTYTGEIVTGIVTSVVTVISLILTQIFYNKKLQKEQKVRFQDMIGEKIANAILAVMEVERKANVYEVFDIQNRISDLNEKIESFGNDLYYLAIMEDWQTFCEYFDTITTARDTYEVYLSQEAAAYLWYGAEYTNKLLDFIRRQGMANHMPEMGLLFIADFMTWREAFESALIKDANKCSCKLVEHRGRSWEDAKSKVRKKLERKNLLSDVENEPGSEGAIMVFETIDDIKQQDADNEKMRNKKIDFV